jgi:hypothetical protein
MNHVIGSIDIESHLHMVGSTYFDDVTSKDSGDCVSFWMVVLKHLEISTDGLQWESLFSK